MKRYRDVVAVLFRLVDASVIVAAWLASYGLRFELLPLLPSWTGDELPPFATYAALSPMVAVLWMVVFDAMCLYESRRLTPLVDELKLLLRAHGLALLYFVALTYFEHYRYSRMVMIYFAVVAAVAIMVCRCCVRLTLRVIRTRGYNIKRVLLVGDGVLAGSLLARIERYPELGLHVVGTVAVERDAEIRPIGRPVLGSLDEIRELVRAHAVEEVLIALPQGSQHDADRVLELLKDETVVIQLVVDVRSYTVFGCETEEFDGLPVVRLNDTPLLGLGGIAKRVTDVVLSLAGLIVFSPLLLSIALAVKLSSRGPVLYVQERMSLNGTTFRMLKFRSMRLDAETTSGAVWAKANDERRTALGTFLRKTSLDELPQLWNVLRGDMSLVGPRPERPVFVDQFRKQVPQYMLRHKVKCGITGWAQINGWRGNTNLHRRIECDLFYIRNWSYALDLKILTMTLWKGFINKNAY